jgi:hypothetical protein
MSPSASDFHSDAEVTSDSNSGQATLTSDSSDSPDIDLAPHEKRAAELLKANLDGEHIDGLDEHEPSLREMLGLVERDESDDSVDLDGTILDPDHAVWNSGPDDWVESVADAESEVENAMRTLTQEGIFKTSVTESRGGEPVAMRVSVEDV